jgi:putative transposase
MQYRCVKTPAATYFFTIVTYQRQSLFSEAETVDVFRNAFRLVKSRFSPNL